MKNILWIATKPPFPTIDGGRLLLWNSLRALKSAGYQISLIAPLEGDTERNSLEAALAPFCHPILVPVRRIPRILDGLRARLIGQPFTVVRHTLPAVRSEIRRQLTTYSYSAVVAEQVQALGNILGLDRRGVPLLWRAQNVESDLWAATSAEVPWARPFLADEARRLAEWEGQAVAAADATLALTRQDVGRLSQLSKGIGRVHHLPAPYDDEGPAAPKRLSGNPALVLFGSSGWRPNHHGEARFLHQIWPAVLRRLPEARLHLFGGGADGVEGVVLHPRPTESRDAFVPGSILVVPLWVASGVRMKILEAWSRGVVVVATPTAARGLDAHHGKQLLLAEKVEEFVAACELLTQPKEQAKLVRAGRLHLAKHHSLERFAKDFEEVCTSLELNLT